MSIGALIRKCKSRPLATALLALTTAATLGVGVATLSAYSALLRRSVMPDGGPGTYLLEWRSVAPLDRNLVEASLGYGEPTRGSSFALSTMRLLERYSSDTVIFGGVVPLGNGPDSAVVDLGSSFETATVALVSDGFFATAGVRRVAGRLPVASDGDSVAVISHGYWRRVFGGSMGTIGRSVRINGQSVTVIGVTEPYFYGFDRDLPQDVWLPLRDSTRFGVWGGPSSWLQSDRLWTVMIAARFQPQLGKERAAGLIQAQVAQSLNNLGLANSGVKVELVDAASGWSATTRSLPTRLRAVFAGSALLLGLGFVASLAMWRTLAHPREMERAVRLALGMSPQSCRRECVLDSIQLGLVTVVLGIFGYVVVSQQMWSAMQLAREVSGLGPLYGLGPVDAARIIVMCATGLAVINGGLLWITYRTTSEASVVRAGRTSQSRQAVFVERGWIVASAVVVTVLTSIALGLGAKLAKSVNEAETVELDRLVIVRIKRANGGLVGPQTVNRLLDLRAKLSALPITERASFASMDLWSGLPLTANAQIGARPLPSIGVFFAAPDFARTVGLPLVEGRDVGEEDTPGSPPVALVNETLARAIVDQGSPLGQQISISFLQRPVEVAGVFRDSSAFRLGGQPQPLLILPYRQAPVIGNARTQALVVKTRQPAWQAVGPVREALSSMDRAFAVVSVTTGEDWLFRVLAVERMSARVGALAVFTALGACASLIIFSVAEAIRTRARELAIRSALGAPSWRLRWALASDGLVSLGLGWCIGYPLALWLGTTFDDLGLSAVPIGILGGITFCLTVSMALLVAVLDPNISRELRRQIPVAALYE